MLSRPYLLTHAPASALAEGIGSSGSSVTSSANARDLDDALLDIRRRFARALVRPGGNACLLNADNTADRWVPIEEAVRSGRPFFIEGASDLLIVDCDDRDRAPLVHGLADSCRTLGFVPVVVASGQLGRLHLFARVPDEAAHARLTEQAHASGLDVRQSIRPPLCPHRLGFIPALVEPAPRRSPR